MHFMLDRQHSEEFIVEEEPLWPPNGIMALYKFRIILIISYYKSS